MGGGGKRGGGLVWEAADGFRRELPSSPGEDLGDLSVAGDTEAGHGPNQVADDIGHAANGRDGLDAGLERLLKARRRSSLKALGAARGWRPSTRGLQRSPGTPFEGL